MSSLFGNRLTGRILLGCGGAYVQQRQPDVMVQGTGVEPIHCYIENVDGIVTLYPLGEMTSVDGQPVATPARLTQGMRALSIDTLCSVFQEYLITRYQSTHRVDGFRRHYVCIPCGSGNL